MKEKKMVDPTDNEISAMLHAGDRAGEYLNSLGKTDIMDMTRDEFMAMVDAICTGFTEHMAANPDIPF